MDTERTAYEAPGGRVEAAEFIERFTRLLEQEGGSRIGGRIVALLLLSATERPIEEMAEQLQASKASISTNARTLEQWGVLERVTHPGDRRDYYRIRDDGLVVLLERRLAWMRRLRDVAGEGALTAEADDPVVRQRFSRLCRVHEAVVRDAERMVRRLRAGQGDGA